MVWIFALPAWLNDKHRALSRFAGYRQAVAVGIAYPIAVAASLIFGPPSNVTSWPAVAQDALAGLVGGIWRLALGGWIAHYTALCDWLPAGRARRLTRLAGLTLVAMALSAGLGDLGRASVVLAEFPLPAIWRVVVAALWSTAMPLAIGLLPMGYVSIAGWINAFPLLQRLLHTGMAPGGAWMGQQALKKHTRPLPKNHP